MNPPLLSVVGDRLKITLPTGEIIDPRIGEPYASEIVKVSTDRDTAIIKACAKVAHKLYDDWNTSPLTGAHSDWEPPTANDAAKAILAQLETIKTEVKKG